MKKIRILGILSIIFMAASIIINFEDEYRDFKEGYEEGARKANAMPDNLYRVSLRVVPTESADSIFNQEAGRKVPYRTSEVTTYAQPSKWITPATLLYALSAFAFVYGFYCFMRLLFEVSRRNVFCHKNVWRIRVIAYSYAATSVSTQLIAWIVGSAAVAQTHLPGYQIIGHAEPLPEWIPVIMLIILAECFALGVKMKEEQDLTI